MYGYPHHGNLILVTVLMLHLTGYLFNYYSLPGVANNSDRVRSHSWVHNVCAASTIAGSVPGGFG